jgi:hypothetical protein
MQPKAIHDEMGAVYDEYGRMSAKLGLEVPFTNNLNQTFVMRAYADAPTEILADGATQIWKITHNGVDTHPIHFHLFDVQLINRVGWDGAIRLPDATELGWKDTVRISPLEDTIVAVRPQRPKPPFGLPDSVRYLNPALPPGATEGFTAVDQFGNPIVPPPSNVMYNFGWEYVWHCHILSHEEADMMRPVKFNVGRSLPAAPVLSYAVNGGNLLVLTWTDATPGAAPATLGNLSNEVGFRVERATITNNKVGTYAVIGNALANATTFTDSTGVPGTRYSYRVVAYNAAGTVTSNAVAPAAAPTNVVATLQSGPKIVLTWTDNATNETGFVIERSQNGSPFAPLTPPATTAANVRTFTDTTVASSSNYTYRVAAVNAGGQSAWALSNSVTVPAAPTAPLNLAGTATATNNNRASIALNWQDNSNNETGFTLQRATDAAFTVGLTSANIAANTQTVTQTGLSRGVTYYYRLRADNFGGSSAWVQTSVTTP